MIDFLRRRPEAERIITGRDPEERTSFMLPTRRVRRKGETSFRVPISPVERAAQFELNRPPAVARVLNQPPAPERSWAEAGADVARDSAVSLAKGVIGTGEAAVGLGNILTLGGLGSGMQSIGYDPKTTKEYLAGFQSPDLHAAQAEVAAAKGFFPSLEAGLRNPSVPLQAAVESLPPMLGGGAVARVLAKMAPTLSPLAGAAFGEGAIGAGQAAEQTRQETGGLTPAQAALAVSSGVTTAVIGRFAGKLAQKLGIDDPDVLLAGGGVDGPSRNVLLRLAGGIISEGALEELPQSAQEQVHQNIATGRPWAEGVPETAASGLLAGGLMGGAVNLRPRRGDSPARRALDRMAGQNAVETGQKAAPESTGVPESVAPPFQERAITGAEDVIAAEEAARAPAPAPFLGQEDFAARERAAAALGAFGIQPDIEASPTPDPWAERAGLSASNRTGESLDVPQVASTKHQFADTGIVAEQYRQVYEDGVRSGGSGVAELVNKANLTPGDAAKVERALARAIAPTEDQDAVEPKALLRSAILGTPSTTISEQKEKTQKAVQKAQKVLEAATKNLASAKKQRRGTGNAEASVRAAQAKLKEAEEWAGEVDKFEAVSDADRNWIDTIGAVQNAEGATKTLPDDDVLKVFGANATTADLRNAGMPDRSGKKRLRSGGERRSGEGSRVVADAMGLSFPKGYDEQRENDRIVAAAVEAGRTGAKTVLTPQAIEAGAAGIDYRGQAASIGFDLDNLMRLHNKAKAGDLTPKQMRQYRTMVEAAKKMDIGRGPGESYTFEDHVVAKAKAEESEPQQNRRNEPDLREPVGKFIEENPNATREEIAAEAKRLRTELNMDPLTGLGSRRAMEASEKTAKAVAVLDGQGLGWWNKFSLAHGDRLLKGIANAMRFAMAEYEGATGFRLGGDEYAIHGPDQDTLSRILARVNEILEDGIFDVTLEDGTRRFFKGVNIDYATGDTRGAADSDLAAARKELDREGLRAKKGERPAGLVELDQAGREVERDPVPELSESGRAAGDERPADPAEQAQGVDREPAAEVHPRREPAVTGSGKTAGGAVDPGSDLRGADIADGDSGARRLPDDGQEADFLKPQQAPKDFGKPPRKQFNQDKSGQGILPGDVAFSGAAVETKVTPDKTKAEEDWDAERAEAEKKADAEKQTSLVPAKPGLDPGTIVERINLGKEGVGVARGRVLPDGQISVFERETNGRVVRVTPEELRPPHDSWVVAAEQRPLATAVTSETIPTEKPKAIEGTVDAAAAETEKKPSEAQIEAGNYRKGKARISGIELSIENEAGSKRRPEWPTLRSHYGYILGTVGKDKEHIDAFIKPGTPEDYSGPVYVINQHVDGRFDEHKVMLGWPDDKEAQAAYLENYTKGWKGLKSRGVFPTVDAFKEWLKTGDHSKPAPVRKAETQAKPQAKPPVAPNAVFTDDAYAAAKARMEARGKKLGGGTAQAGIDPEMMRDGLTMAGYHIERGARTFAAYAKAMISDLGDWVKPYLRGFYENVRYYPGFDNTGMSTAAEADAAMADLDKAPVEAEQEAAPEEGNAAGSARLANGVFNRLSSGEGIKNNPELTKMAELAFGGTRASGKWSPKDAYDAMEAGVNRWIQANAKELMAGDPKAALDRLRAVLQLLPTQTDRTREQQELQQFSTPPTEAFVAAKALGIRPGETVMEPSAGIGGLAVFAEGAGAKVVTNEISPRRAEILKSLGFKVTSVDAENLNALLPADIRPDAFLMNPPFSSTGGRLKANKTEFGARHVEQALARMKPGGRLVAIVGQGMAMDRPAFSEWWKKIGAKYNVVANYGIPGEEYGKYGTTFGNQILVIDKTAPKGLTSVKHGALQSLEEALNALDEIGRNRVSVDPQGALGDGRAEGGRGDGKLPGRSETPDVGVRGPAGSRPAGRPSKGGQATGKRPGQGVPEVSGEGRPGPAQGPAPASAGRPDEAVRDVVPEGGRGGLRPAGPVGFFKPKQAKEEPKRRELTGGTFIEARPQRLDLTGIPKHPASIVEPASMASVSPPPITYEGKIPASLATSGDLSDLQLEAVLYAGQRHAQTLPGGQRAGFLIGDGPGVGKTRELASITLDNWNQGRKRTLWLSVGWNLVSGVRDGLNQVGAEEIPLHRLDSIERGDPAAFGDGVLFATYSTFREPERIAQVQEWLGEDPLIHFDEAHKAKNLVSELGEPTKTGAAVLKIQNENPTARVTYASATAATEPRNMGYMVRLGLWGPGTPFAKFNDFQTAIETGGVGAMEMISRDVKALGIGTSRGISMEGVEFRETVHNLTQDQKDVYNRSAKLWQEVLKRIDEAIAVTGGKSFARSRALSQFYGAMQRFFKAVATSSKVPTLIKRMEEELKEGRSVVVRLVSTAEGRTEDQVAKAKAEGTDLDDLDITPRETITGYIENSFPTTLYQDYTDPDTGQTMTRPVLDSSGEPVQDPEAVAMRDELLRMVSDLRLPEHPLDQMLKHFGADKVAEVTGRNKRLIVNKVTGKREWASRNPKSANAAERDAFQGGKKRILLLNDSGGTGMDAHADNKAKNKQQRVYFIFETGWSADNELQALGRVNRTNQASAPIYDLVSTDLSGERRFYSTIAKRLEQLGALSRGDRSGVSAGGLADFNFENDYGKGAARAVYDDLEYEDSETLLQMGFIDPKTGRVRIQNSDKTDVPKFLNRVLALEVDKQAEVFGKFEQAFSAIVQKAKDEDRYDTGVSDLKAERVTVVGKPTVVSTDPTSGATTEHVELSAEYKTHPMPWTMAQGWANKEGSAYYTNARSGRVSLAVKSANITNNETGRIEQFYRLFKPNGSVESIPETELRERYDRVSEPKALWDAEYAETPKTRKESVHLITGVTLPIWDKLGTRSQVLKVVRTDTEDGKRFVGVKIPTKEVGKVLKALNVRTVTADPAQVFQSVNGGASIDLDRGLRLSRVRIRGDQRIEIAGKDIASRGKELVALGALEERIDFKFRYFVPDDDVRGVKVLASILKAYPVVETSEAKFSAKPKPAPFYSPLERAASALKQPMKGSDALRFLSTREGVKAAEIKWTGLDDFLRRKGEARVTPAEIQEYLKANAVTVKEVTLQDRGRHRQPDEPGIRPVRDALRKLGYEIGLDRTDPDAQDPFLVTDLKTGDVVPGLAFLQTGAYPEEAQRLATQMFDFVDSEVPGGAKFGGPKTTLPGGTNYKEVLLTLPSASTFKVSSAGGPIASLPDPMDFASRAEADAELVRRKRDMPGSHHNVMEYQPTAFRSSHFDEPNILAHVRFNERTDSNGKRVLFLEEIQSDWAQTGRREGFQGEDRAKAAERDALLAKETLTREEQARLRAVRLEIDNDRTMKPGAVPSAPFVEKTEDWTALALKSVLHYAAANGFDSVAWTPGSVQAERYDLSKQVKQIDVLPHSGGAGRDVLMVLPSRVANFSVDSAGIVGKSPRDMGIDGKRLDEVVGKEMADKIMSTTENKRYTGVDLKVGGEGMRAFYDRIVPQVAEKIGKKFGAKVGTTNLVKNRTSKEELAEIDRNGSLPKDFYDQPVQSLPITPEMRAGASEGFPLFKTDDGAPSTPPVDIAAVRREFPRAEVRELGPGTFEVQDGLRTIHVRVDDDGLAGTVDRGAFRAAYGRDFDPANDAVVGAWVQVPRGGVMWLAKTADSSVLRHERFHYEKGKAPGTESFPERIARAFGFGSRIALTDEERAALYKKFEPQAKMDQERRSAGSWDRLSATEREKVVEEYQAEAYAHWRPEEKANSLFSKILETARRFWRAFRPSWESAFERVSRGDTSEGRNGGGDDQARFSAVNRKSDGFVQAEDQYGRYRTLNGAVDVNGNWKRFQELPPDERVLLYHATSRANADAILRDGYDGTNATWGDNPKDYVYMGGKESLGTYSGRHRDAVMVLFEVRRGDVEPDKGTDWKSFLRIPANREFAKRHHGNVSDPSAVETFGLINQVRAHRSTVRAVAVVKDGEIIAKNPDIRYSIAARSESPAKPASPDTDKPSKPLDTGRPLRTGPMDADELTRRVIDASNGTGTPAGTPIEQLAPPEFHRNFSVVLKSGVPKDEAERFARIYAAFDKENNVARGKMSWDQGDKEALKLLGLHTREQFMDALKRGVTFNEPGLRAATRIMHEVREEHESAMATLNAAREAGGGKIDSDEYRAVAATSANLAAWTLALRGEQAEAARAFNARKDLRAGRTDSEKLLGRIFKNIGGLTDKQAEAILRTAELEPKKLPDAIRRAMKPGFWDYVNEWRKGGLLWSPRTFLGVNPFGNALKQAITLLEIPVGAAIDRARGGADSERQVRAGELAAAMAGLADYGPAALKQLRADVWNAMKGVEEFDVNKSRPFEHQVGVIPGPLGKLIRTPFRFLQAADDFFKETAKAQSLYREAFRRARNEGLTGQNATRRAEELIGIGKGSDWQDKRVAGMIDKANRMAMYETFTLPTNYENAGIFGSLASAVQQVERRRGISGAVGLFAPFKSTPAHIAYQSFERSPFGLFLVYNRIKELDSLRKSLDTAKGMQKEDILKDIEAKTQEMVEQMARAVIGSALFGVAASMAALGLLTGSGPADWEDRKVWMDAGNIPTGIKVGDSDWYAYDRFEPAAASIAIAANFPDILKERSFGGQAAAFMNAMQDAWVSKTYLQGLEQFGDVITDPKRYSEKWLRDLVGSFVPAAVAQTAEVLDPTVREKTGSLLDGFRSRVPGLSDDLPASRTGTGEPAKRTGRLGGGSPLNPLGFIRTGSADGDPLAKEFLDADYSPTPPRKTIVIGVGPKGYKRRHEVALLPAELEAFRKADERVTRRLRRLIETDRWQDLDPYVKKQTLQRVYDAAANAVRELVLPRAARRLKQQLSGRSV